jgi:valyl-tRNA synthetase
MVSEAPLDHSVQKAEMEKEIEYLTGFLNAVDKKLGNEKFVANAKPEIVEVEKKKKADAEEKLRVLRESLSNLGH